MTVRTTAGLLLLTLVAGAAGTGPAAAQAPVTPIRVESTPGSLAPFDDSPATAALPVVTSGRCRCLGVDPKDPWLAEAEMIVARNFLRGPDLPLGWTPVGDAVAPDTADPMWQHAMRPRIAACASLQLYDAPPGRVRVLVATYKEQKRIPVLGALLDKSRPKGMAPVGMGEVYVVMLEPDIPEMSKQWMTATSRGGGGAELMALGQTAESGDLAAFDAAAAAYSASHPTDVMPQAWRAGMLVKRGDLTAGREAARAALERAAGDPQAEAESLHWLYIAEYLLKSGPEVTLPLADRQVDAARRAGSRRMLVRALYDRACARGVAGDTQGALADLRDCLQREAAIGRSEYRDTAPAEPDFAAFRDTAEFKDAITR